MGILSEAPVFKGYLIVKSDTDLPTPVRAMHVYVATADEPASLKFTPQGNDDGNPLTFTFPAGVFEVPWSAKRVWSAGSTANLVVHGVV